ncbi:glycosyltransferase family 2 protein [Erysipelothrix rhusiopathiae]|uniref:Glycosyltransferase family 2 protein n=1 Tax=Erysipelothrix rhusiopathiae TaxID=1648 RepID=A0A6S6I0V3_ERYRH|nr:glycosyltransferase family 2 protein [Erysipelothrix rhusiopathiae]
MKFSVIIPSYNAATTICSTIESIIKAFESECEIIVIDDFSTDNTEHLICNLIKSDQKYKIISYHKNTNNLGVSASRNIGIKKSMGEFVMFVDADDQVSPQIKPKIKEIIDKYENVDVVRFNHTKSNGSVAFMKIITSLDEIPLDLLKSFYFHSSCTQVVRRNLYKNIGYDETLIFGEDMLLSFSLLKSSRKTVLLSEKLYEYKHYDNSVSNRIDISHIQQCLQSISRVYDNVLDLFCDNVKFQKILDRKRNKEMSLQLLKIFRTSKDVYDLEINKYRDKYRNSSLLTKDFYSLHAFTIEKELRLFEMILNNIYINIKGKSE